MIQRYVVRSAMLLLSLPVISGNRIPPKWQGVRNVSLAITQGCVAAELSRFGQITVERGEVPESGKVRLYLFQVPEKRVATVYLNGERGFSSVWMDAPSDRLGKAIWRNLKRSCLLHSLGEQR